MIRRRVLDSRQTKYLATNKINISVKVSNQTEDKGYL